MSKHSRIHAQWSNHLFILLVLGIELIPLYMMMQISLKTNDAFLANPWWPASPGNWAWGNFAYAASIILPLVMNTLMVATTGTLASLVFALCGAYYFARRKTPFARALWGAFMVLMLLPSITNIVPLFTLLKELSLLNTLYALIAVGVASSLVFNMYVLRGFIEDIPQDLFEAAEIDGAGHWHQVRQIVWPLAQPVLGTLAILVFLQKWNEFLLPLIVLRDQDKFTIGVGLIYLDGQFVKQWGQTMAAYFLASLPLLVLFAFTMRLFVRGLSQGAVKG